MTAALAEGVSSSNQEAALSRIKELKNRSELAKLLRTGAMIEGIIDRLWEEVQVLQRTGAATNAEIQSKFAGQIEASYQGADGVLLLRI